jgi:hypothetical protein
MLSFFRRVALPGAMIFIIVAKCISLDAQPVAPANQADSITVSIALDKDQFPVGQSPWVLVTMKNLTDHDLPFHFDTIRLHIEGGNGEPPTKLRQRIATGKLHPGETPLMEDGNAEMFIPAGKPRIQKIDVIYFYDLSVPGKYSVYADVRDPMSRKWLRTKTVQFEILAQ